MDVSRSAPFLSLQAGTGNYGWHAAKACLNALWETAIPISEHPAQKGRLLCLVRQRSQAVEAIPFGTYAAVLKSHLPRRKDSGWWKYLQGMKSEGIVVAENRQAA